MIGTCVRVCVLWGDRDTFSIYYNNYDCNVIKCSVIIFYMKSQI